MKSLRTERDDVVAELDKEQQMLEKVEKVRKEEVEGPKEEKKWEEGRVDAKKRHKEDTDSLIMRRKREAESWRTRVEGQKLEKEWVKEAFRAKLKNILEGVKKKREVWGKEKEKEGEMAGEKKGLEEKWAEKKLWAEADDRAQGRTVELEVENKRFKDEAANMEKNGEEAQVAKKTAKEAKEREQKRSDEEATESKKTIEKL